MIRQCIINILYYNENDNNKNSDKPYIFVVVCLLVMLNQWKQLNLLFIQLQRLAFPGFLLRVVFGVSARERPLAFGWRFTVDHRTVLHWKICMTIAASTFRFHFDLSCSPRLELNSAGHRPSRNKFGDPWLRLKAFPHWAQCEKSRWIAD